MRPNSCAAGLCAAVVIAVAAALAGAPAAAAPKQKAAASKSSQKVAVASPPRSRITVRRRSFLDAGTEVLPGERKFTDYALPPGYSPLGPVDNTAFSHRSPLPGPFDLPSRNNPWPWNWCTGC
jgi:hypothetical protein